MRRRIIAIGLSAVMLLSLFSVSYGDEAGEGQDLTTNTVESSDEVNSGDDTDNQNNGESQKPSSEGSQESQEGEDSTDDPTEESSEETNYIISGDYKFEIIGQDENNREIFALWFNEEKITSSYLLIGKKTNESGEVEYSVLKPSDDASAYSKVYVYNFNGDGKGTVYSGTGVITIKWHSLTGDTVNTSSGKYYLKSGSIVKRTSSWNVTSGGVYYTIGKDGSAKAFNGIYKKYWYKNGKIAKGSTFYAVSKNYLYKVSAKGYAKKYKTKKKGYYYKKALWTDNNSYIFKVTKKTGKASKYIKDSRKSGTFKYTYSSKLYTVEYKTGKVIGLFSGIYSSKLYEKGVFAKKTGVYYNKYISSGVVKKSTKTWYTVVGNYVYMVTADGSASVYIKDSTRSDTYQYVSGDYLYNIYYDTGIVESKEDDNQLRAVILKAANSYLGYGEPKTGGPSHKAILKIYNDNKPLPRNYTVKSTDAWCATYVSAMFIKNEWSSIFPVECSCAYQIAKWQKMGRWTENDAYVPKKGDIIYYDWQDSGKGDNKGRPDHVGIVEKVENKTITVIEGNYKDRVTKRKIKVNGRYIRGYGRPQYIKKK